MYGWCLGGGGGLGSCLSVFGAGGGGGHVSMGMQNLHLDNKKGDVRTQ